MISSLIIITVFITGEQRQFAGSAFSKPLVICSELLNWPFTARSLQNYFCLVTDKLAG